MKKTYNIHFNIVKDLKRYSITFFKENYLKFIFLLKWFLFSYVMKKIILRQYSNFMEESLK